MDELTPERAKGWQDVIDYLKSELATQNKRTAGKPKLVARLNTIGATVIQTIINTLEEWQALKVRDRAEGRKAFLALPVEERRRLISDQVMLMDEQDREAIQGR